MRSQDSGGFQTNSTNSSKFVTGNSNTSDQQNSVLNSPNSTSNQSANWSKIQALKQRKCELEKLLNEKNLLLQQIQKQEAQIINDHHQITLKQSCNPPDSSGNNTILRRRLGTAYKLPKNLLNCKDDGGDIEKLLFDKKIQQEICNASYKLANDPNVSKSLRRTHKAEYEAAQQKLIAIHHNLSILKKWQLTQTKSNSLPTCTTPLPSTSPGSAVNPVTSIAANVNLTKSPSIQHSSPDISIKQSTDNLNHQNTNKIHGHNNNTNVNNYYTTERRNSMKSTILSSPNHLDETNSFLADRTLVKNHRSNYDTTRLVPILGGENNRCSSGHTISSAYNNYLYNNYAIQQQQQHQQKLDDIENYNNNHNSPQQECEGNYFFYTNNNYMKYLSNKLPNEKYSNYSPNHQLYDDGGFGNLPPNGQLRHNYSLTGVRGSPVGENQQNIIGILSENFYNNSRKYDAVDAVSISPSTVTSLNDQHIGLGGYWRTLPNNERVWCAVENCYDSNGTQLQQTKLKKISAPMTIKASSLGNFDVISTKDECVDQISISSMNSETSKKSKEKQWLETSLDGPLVRPKSVSNTNEIGSRSLPNTGYSSTSMVISHQHAVSPTFSRYNHYTTAHPHHHSYKYHKYGNRSKLSSQSMSNNTYRPNVTKLEDQNYLSQSTSVLNNSNNIIINDNHQCSPHELHQYSPSQQGSLPPGGGGGGGDSGGGDHHLNLTHSAQSPTLLYSSGQLSPKYNTMKITRSPIIANINKSSDIRIESPKNMTVIQPATFMPYKEVSKPFEMSDFYKYSTKFRQKDAKQQQQHTVATAMPPVVADAN